MYCRDKPNSNIKFTTDSTARNNLASYILAQRITDFTSITIAQKGVEHHRSCASLTVFDQRSSGFTPQ